MLIWMDGFDHYGDDEAKLTEGVYDSVDSSFSLSSANPRTGNFALRRSSAASNGFIKKDSGSNNSNLACGFSFFPSQLPTSGNSYPLVFFKDSDGTNQIVVMVETDGSCEIRIGNKNGQLIGASSPNVITANDWNHIEFAAIADTETFIEVIVFSEFFNSGNLDNYTFKGDFAPPASGGSKADFSIVADDYGSAIKIGTGPIDSHIGLYKEILSDGSGLVFTNVEFKFKLTSLNTGDNGLMSFRDGNFNAIFIFHVARDSGVDPNQAPNISLTDQPGNPGNPIGTSSVDLNTWYRAVVSYDENNMVFTCSIFSEEDGSLFASLNILVSTLSEIKYISFENDNITSSEAGTSQFDEIIISSGFSESNGICELRVNGVTEISSSNTRTTITENRNYRYVSLAGGSTSTHGVVTDFDDFYIWNLSGAWNNSFLGDRRCYLLRPNQDTNIADFDPSVGGFGYKMIDDESPDDDSTYIIAEAYLQSGSPLAGTSEFKIENLPNGASLISGINLISRASKTDNTSAEIYTSINSGADSISESAHALTTSYQYYNDIYEYDPSTISALTKDSFNALSVSVTADDLDPGEVVDSPTDNDNPLVVPTDYRAHWTGINVSGSLLLDESANNYDGTITGAVVSGDYLDFDGINDKVSIPSAAHPGSSSVAADTWTHVFTFDADDVSTAGAARRMWAARSAHQVTNIPVFLYYVGGNELHISTNSEPTTSTSQNFDVAVVSVTANTKYTIIVEMDNRVRRTYVNGSLVDTQTHTSSLYGVTTHFFGSNRVGTGNFYDGGLKLLYIYDRVLTSDERTAIFAEA